MEDHSLSLFSLHVPSKLHTRNILLPTALRSTTLLIMTSTGSTSVSPVCQTSVSASHLCLWKFTSLRSVNDLPTKIQPSTSSRLHQVYRSNPRPISNSQLHTLLHFHLRPIYDIVSIVPYSSKDERSYLRESFTLRCFQRLSRPHLATLLCRWHDNRCTRGASIPVLSY